jgi:ABC-type lipoprotein release transport system permease subunit
MSGKKNMRAVRPLLDSLLDKQFRTEADFDKTLEGLLGKSEAGKIAFHLKAASIKYRLKRRIVLSFQSLDGHIAYDAFRVVGVYKTGNTAFDGLNLFVRMSDIGPVANLGNGQVNQFAILLTSVEHDDQVARQIKKMMPGMDVQTWDEILPEAGMYTSAMNYYLFIFMIIILLALGFGIVNTMLMAVLERIKELGMLMAIGMNKRRIFRMIMLETVFLGMTGAVIGMAISYGLIWYTGKTGLDLTSLYQEGFEAMGFSPLIYPTIGWESFFQLILLVVLTGVLASIYPARKAVKLNPSEALRIDM